MTSTSSHAPAIRHLEQADARLAEVIRRVGPCLLQARGGRFDVVARSILAQQISVAAARTIVRRLQGQLPGRRISARGIADLSDEQLQAAGISQQKRSYLRDLSERALDGRLNFRRFPRLDDEVIVAELIQVKGIGRWTAQMFLLFGLGRSDIFAPDDLGLQNAMARVYFPEAPPSREALEQISASWAPWRSVASWYLWRSLDLTPATPSS